MAVIEDSAFDSAALIRYDTTVHVQSCLGLEVRSQLSKHPSSPWQLDIRWSDRARLDRTTSERFLAILSFAQSEAQHLVTFLRTHHPSLLVARIGLVYDGIEPLIRLVPLLGVARGKWQPILAPNERYSDQEPGFVDTRSGPRQANAVLDKWQTQLRAGELEPWHDDNTFYGDASDSNLFARIVRGSEEQRRVYQDTHTVAVLTPFPNARYITVLVPRYHASSDILALPPQEYQTLLQSAFHTMRIFDRIQAQGVAMIMEGFEIDYAHVKLIPRFAGPERQHEGIFMETYQGYLTSQSGPPLAWAQMIEQHLQLVGALSSTT